MKQAQIAVLSGDGIGPEVMDASWPVAVAAGSKCGVELIAHKALVGGAAIDATQTPLPKETLATCKQADAIFFGSVGGPKWEHLPAEEQPERGALLPLRKQFGLFANLRPAICYPALASASPLKPEIVGNGFDILCVRELTGGLYFGQPKSISTENGETVAIDTMRYTRSEIERIARVGFTAAQSRGKKLCSVDKANVLRNSLLWREVIEEVAQDFPAVTLSHLYVDNAAMQLVKDPSAFDTIVTENLFGDILSDELAQLTGSMGMLPSASLGEKRADGSYFGMYEPSGGSAPDIAGKGIANPIAQILSAALMFRHSLNCIKAGELIEQAVTQTIEAGYRTADISSNSAKETVVSTAEMAAQILSYLE